MTTLVAAVAAAPLKRGAKGAAVLLLQTALRAAGHELVPDGAFGTITELAVKRFQASHGLVADGIVGRATATALEPAAQVSAPKPLGSAMQVAPWLSVARALTGTAEIPGAKTNPLILSWRDEILAAHPALKPNLGWYVNDDTPWCGLFVAYCITQGGQKPAAAPLYATNWYHAWADGVRLKEPALGAVLVKTRNGGGHVTFYEGEDDTWYYGRGGNQSNKVNVQKVAKNNEVLGFMWPKGAPAPIGGRVRTTFAGAVSGTEA